MIKRSLFALFILAFVLVACSPASATSAPSRDLVAPNAQSAGKGIESPAMPAEMAPAAPALDMAADGATSNSASSGPDRLVIQNADLNIVVDDPAKSMDAVSAMATKLGGFVVTSNLYKTRTDQGVEVPQASITVRVPAKSLDDALAQIKALTHNPAEDVLSENRSGQDVTKEYTDVNSRISNLEQTEAQLREIMASATKTEDVMNVFNQLTQVREQIEVLKGQKKYYEESAALSAINVQLVARAAVAPLTIGGWQPAGVARDAIQSLINALKYIANAAIWIVLFLLPVLLVIGIPVGLIIYAVRRVRLSRKPKVPPEPETK